MGLYRAIFRYEGLQVIFSLNKALALFALLYMAVFTLMGAPGRVSWGCAAHDFCFFGDELAFVCPLLAGRHGTQSRLASGPPGVDSWRHLIGQLVPGYQPETDIVNWVMLKQQNA